ncbi:MFS transporter [Cuneatibacter caecimuris]|uniref:Putative MFS family arabinose efflux permease n=1 Tax=Cuneatibacter caecimuris TaxID=1796618 RepID=A0A4Q7PNE0_9FIRM|nr:MFS transporter [Cuneatibacter caecimuris]RZT02479.1 putative MFS family arabinose efflux permease [Cuneatibacter caecimuris]
MKRSRYKGKMHLTTRLNIHYASIQGLYWIASASMYAFLVVFLDARGFSTAQIGYINAFRTGMAVLAQLFYAYLGDRYKQLPLKYIIAVVMGVSICANGVLQFSSPDFAGMMALFLILGLTECSIVSLMDSLALQFINLGVPMNYSACRATGSVCYAFTCVLLGRAIDMLGADIVVTVHGVVLALYVVSVVTFLTFRSIPAGTEDSAKPSMRHYQVMPRQGSILKMLRNQPQYRWLLIANFIICLGFCPCSNFMATLISNAGGDNTVLGFAMFVSAFIEMPMMAIIFPRLSRRYSMEKLLFASSVFHLIRWLLVGMATNAWLLAGLQTFQMITYALSLPASVYYINTNIPEENKIKGQTCYNIAGNLGNAAGTAVSGVLIEVFSVRATVFVNCGVLLAGVICFWIMMHRPKERAAAM